MRIITNIITSKCRRCGRITEVNPHSYVCRRCEVVMDAERMHDAGEEEGHFCYNCGNMVCDGTLRKCRDTEYVSGGSTGVGHTRAVLKNWMPVPVNRLLLLRVGDRYWLAEWTRYHESVCEQDKVKHFTVDTNGAGRNWFQRHFPPWCGNWNALERESRWRIEETAIGLVDWRWNFDVNGMSLGDDEE